MHIHGTADRLIPYNGGRGAGVVNGPSVADVDAFWRNADQCGPPAVTTAGPVTTSTAGCADNRAVVLTAAATNGPAVPPSSSEVTRCRRR